MNCVDELRSRGIGYTAKEVCERLGVKGYILNRYIHMLKEKGYPVNASGTQFRFYSEDLVRCLHELIVLDEHGMDLEVAVNTIMAEGTVGAELVGRLSEELKGMYVLEAAAKRLGVDASALTLFSRCLQSEGYEFKRNNKRYRIYTEKDFDVIRKGFAMNRNGWAFTDIANWLMNGCPYGDMTKLYTESVAAKKLGTSKGLVAACIRKLEGEGKRYTVTNKGKVTLSDEDISDIEKEIEKEKKVCEVSKGLITSREVAAILGFGDRYLIRKYTSALEDAGYVFCKNLRGYRFYTEKDVELLAELSTKVGRNVPLITVAKMLVNPQSLTETEKLDANRIEKSVYKLSDVVDLIGVKHPNIVRYINYLEDEGYKVQKDSKGRRVYDEELVQLLVDMQKLHIDGMQVKKAAKQVMMDKIKEE
ncbi:hypothetical protein FT641_18075 [Bacillus paranthracis]|uniref:MerR family transcriptional regulator n=1 Tax=Bacillus paranthracis TaxID=2026186 RepID=UPI0018797C48|nr:MerR family transcriptional regulator [Bacillus paranthracis]MBE7114530.1 hypothetical protein [Bacillus paranthracis]MBE7154596.1 hypothetical protein [Bacillus paranthracis]